jgi:hypothetical protein
MNLLIFILVGFGITTIITKSTIFEPLRNFLDTGGEYLRNNFWGLLIVCPLCVGFWIGVLESCIFGSITYNTFIGDNSSIGILNYLWSFIPFIFAKIADGAIVGSITWVIHSLLGYLDSAYEYNQTMDTYYQLKGEDFVKQKNRKPLND